MLSAMNELGVILDVKEHAANEVKKIDNALSSFKFHKKRKPTVLCLIDNELYAYGKNTLMHEKISLAGGNPDLFEGDLSYPKLTQEFLLKLNPEYLLLDKVDTTKLFFVQSIKKCIA